MLGEVNLRAEFDMAQGRFRTKGLLNWALVEYEPGWQPFPVAEQVYRQRAYEPPFEELPWVGTVEGSPASKREVPLKREP